MKLAPTASHLPEWIRTAALAFNNLSRTVDALLSDGLTLPSGVVTGSYTVAPGDYFLNVNASGGAAVITLPALSLGRVLIVKKSDASANVVTVSGTIDGAASFALAVRYASVTVIGGASEWSVI